MGGKGEATHLDEPVAVGTVVDDRQRLLEPGSSNTNHVCDQLADRNDDLRDRNTSKSIHLHMMARLSFGGQPGCAGSQCKARCVEWWGLTQCANRV